MIRVFVWVCVCIWACVCVCLPALKVPQSCTDFVGCFDAAQPPRTLHIGDSSAPTLWRLIRKKNSSHRNCWGFVYSQTCSENLLEAASAALTAHRVTSLSYRAERRRITLISFSRFYKGKVKAIKTKI